MAFYSGTAASLTALRTALLTHAQTDGWVLTGDVLSKAGVYFQITEDATNIKCLGCESNAVANPAPGVVMIGTIWFRSGYTTRLISFPCNYEIFGFDQELYFVVNYDVDSYQWLAFGKSTVPGLAGQGGWCGATIGAAIPGGGTEGPISITPVSGGSNSGGYDVSSAALFWTSSIISTPASPRNAWVNHGLDAHGWTWKGAATDSPIGIRHIVPFIGLQPSLWNSEATLLPLRAYKERSSYKSSLVVDLVNARIFRIDNVSPSDILTIGSDQWKVYPWYRKNALVRDGLGSTLGMNHSGTFGWAIRYEGP